MQKTFQNKLSTLMLLLLTIALGAYVLTVMKYQAEDPLVNALPYIQTAGAARALLVLATLVGLVAVLVQEYGSVEIPAGQTWLIRGWQALVGGSLLAVLLNIMESRTWLELPLLLDIGVLILFTVTVWLMRSKLLNNDFLIGMLLLIGVCLLLGWFNPAHPLEDVVLRIAASGMLIQVAIPLAVLFAIEIDQSALFIPQMIGGGIIVISPLVSLGWVESGIWMAVIPGFSAAIFAIVLYRKETLPRIPLIFFLLHLLLGVFMTNQASAPYMHGTLFSTVQFLLPLIGSLLLIGDRLFPSAQESWLIRTLVLGGSTITISTLLFAGIAQVYLERVFSIGYLDVQSALIPVFSLWTLGAGMMLLGVLLIGVLRFIERN